MKTFITIVVASLLALAASAQARQDDGQAPTKKKERQNEHAAAQGAQPGTNPQPGHPTPRAHDTPGRPYHRGAPAQGETPDSQAIRRHNGFHAQPKPQQVPPVAFDENRKIKGSEHWDGERYAAFRSYRPHRHDRAWYHRHFPRIILICGGYYYWNNFYWYPAWGYNPSYSYYVYDGPIYTGTVDESPDQVIADVQSALQDLGYYEGEVDGILGAPTRQAIIDYQADNGLYQTAAIDQPTLESLGLG